MRGHGSHSPYCWGNKSPTNLCYGFKPQAQTKFILGNRLDLPSLGQILPPSILLFLNTTQTSIPPNLGKAGSWTTCLQV